MLRALQKWLHFAAQEMKLVGSPADLQLLARKVRYIFPRILHYQSGIRRIPPSLQLEPTSICNLRCISCPSYRSTRGKGNMEMPLFGQIIDEAAEVGVKRIHLYLHGEPFLHPRLTEMISHIKSRKLAVHLTTNGSAFNKKMIRSVLESGLTISDHIIFSILGNSKESHEHIMKNVNHDSVVASIETFMQMRHELRKHGPIFEAIMYTMKENQHEVSDFLESWKSKVDHARIARASRSVIRYKKGEETEFQRVSSCPNIWERLTIYWNGDATICCADFDGEYVFGSVRNTSLVDLWNHAQMQKVRECHLRKEFAKVPICEHCDM